jgi:hypothetical protein
MRLTRYVHWRTTAISIAFVSIFLASLFSPICAASEPSLVLNPVTHDITPVGSSGTFSSEVVTDTIRISGTTTPDAKISVTKTVFGAATESSVPVSSSGSFSTTLQFEVGPGFAQGVERGDVKVQVTATQGNTNKALDVPLTQAASGTATPNLVGAVLNAGAPGYPHTFVEYDNPWFFAIGYYVDDSGNTVNQTSRDAVATQLAQFSAVSLHYTDDASNIALIKHYNPNTKVFAYVNPVLCYKSTDPNSEWQLVVKNHPEWFLYPDSTSRASKTNPITAYDGTEQVMDLTTGWRSEIAKQSIAALNKGFDGLYVDCACDDPSLCYGYASNTAPVGNWHAALNDYLTQVNVAGKTNFYNGQSPVVVPSNQDFLNRTSGWMDEGYISYKGWQLSAIDMPKYASAQNKFTMFYAYAPSSGSNARHFYFTSALLSDGYFFYSPMWTQWFSEYGTYLGNPTGQAYQVSGFPGVWTRDYTAVKVIVNPTSAAVTLNVPGYVDSSGQPASPITIKPNDGVILRSWTSLGGQIPAGTSPAACSWGAGRLDLFVQGMNGALYHKSYTGSTWSGWQNLGGKLTSSPAATSPASGVIDVFVRGTNGALYQRSWTGSWSNWISLGGQIAAGTSPAACSWGAGRLDVFVEGTNGALYHRWDTGTWSGWQNLGGKLTSSPAAATAPGSSRIDVVVRGGDKGLWQKTL